MKDTLRFPVRDRVMRCLYGLHLAVALSVTVIVASDLGCQPWPALCQFLHEPDVGWYAALCFLPEC